MYVFDSYVNMFQRPPSPGTRVNPGEPVNNTISHTAYMLATRIEKLFHNRPAS